MFNRQMSFLVRQSIFLACSTRKNHVFNSPELSLSRLETYLKRFARYEDGLLVLNKPCGVSFDRGLLNADSLNPGRDVCLKNALPSIKEFFKIKELFNVKIPERHVSGVTVFADNPRLADETRKWCRLMRERNEPADLYHAVVVGQPEFHSHHFDGTISLQAKNGIKRVVMSQEGGGGRGRSRSSSGGQVKRVSLWCRTVARSSGGEASLVEVTATRAKWNCVRAYLASQLLTPVLGDQLYSSYVKRILGAPVPVDLFTHTHLSNQKLPEALCSVLDLVGGRRVGAVPPLHLHLSTVTVMKGRGRVLQLSSPLPHHFTWSLDRLGLPPTPTPTPLPLPLSS